MIPPTYLYIIIFILLLILILIIMFYLRLKRSHDLITHDKHSLEIKHGLSYENLFPYFNNYPYDARNFRFIGDPIDGISFENDKIVFIEFKTGNSNLSKKQKQIKSLINNRKVEWKEIRES